MWVHLEISKSKISQILIWKKVGLLLKTIVVSQWYWEAQANKGAAFLSDAEQK